jgi:hypothetical protein
MIASGITVCPTPIGIGIGIAIDPDPDPDTDPDTGNEHVCGNSAPPD